MKLYIVCEHMIWYNPKPQLIWREVYQSYSELDCYKWMINAHDAGNVPEYRLFVSVE